MLRRGLVFFAGAAMFTWACLSGPHATLEVEGAEGGASGSIGSDGGFIIPVDDSGKPLAFVANASDFTGFTGWKRFDLGEGDTTVGIHIPGPRSVFINKMPPKGSTVFPQGTIIVKAVQNGPPENWQIFAMAKRGNSFNVFGAIDWEWFGLSLFSSGVVTIEWRGIGPPADAGYGGPASNPCNNCHRAAQINDYVQTPALELGRL